MPFPPRPKPSGLNGAIPTTYDANWQYYTDLTSAQIAAFQAFPQDLAKYAALRRWQKEIGGITVNGVSISTNANSQTLLTGLAVAAMRNPSGSYSFTSNGTAQTINSQQALQMFDAISAHIQSCRAAEASLLAGMNTTPPTVTSRAQVDAALAAIKS